MTRLIQTGALLYAAVLVVAPEWALRIFLWCWLGGWLVCAVLLVGFGVARLRSRFSLWRHARRTSTLFPYGYDFGSQGEFMEDRRVAP